MDLADYSVARVTEDDQGQALESEGCDQLKTSTFQ